MRLAKMPGVAETLDWAQALVVAARRPPRRGAGGRDARLRAQGRRRRASGSSASWPRAGSSASCRPRAHDGMAWPLPATSLTAVAPASARRCARPGCRVTVAGADGRGAGPRGDGPDGPRGGVPGAARLPGAPARGVPGLRPLLRRRSGPSRPRRGRGSRGSRAPRRAPHGEEQQPPDGPPAASRRSRWRSRAGRRKAPTTASRSRCRGERAARS